MLEGSIPVALFILQGNVRPYTYECLTFRHCNVHLAWPRALEGKRCGSKGSCKESRLLSHERASHSWLSCPTCSLGAISIAKTASVAELCAAHAGDGFNGASLPAAEAVLYAKGVVDYMLMCTQVWDAVFFVVIVDCIVRACGMVGKVCTAAFSHFL